MNRAACPACGHMLDLRTLTWGQEDFAFPCKRCGARLHKRTYLFPIMMLGGIALLIAGRFLLPRDELFMWSTLWAISLLVVTFLTTRIRIAGDDVPDPPKEEEFTGPPPQGTYFRGSSGPPPEKDPD